MQRKLFLFAAFFAAGFIGAKAQQPTRDTPPPYRGTNTRVAGVFVTPVAGVPFSATVVIESDQLLPDGTTEQKRTINMIARDSAGRIHNERRSLMPESFHGTPPLLEVHIFDPQTRLNTFYVPGSRIARQRLLPELPRSPETREPWGTEENLGVTTLNGLQAKGTRRTFTIPAFASGTGKPVEVTDEYWYSEELHMNLLVRHSDPRTGEQAVGISGIKREEPQAALFEVPRGFKIVDMTPPAGSPGLGSGDGSNP